MMTCRAPAALHHTVQVAALLLLVVVMLARPGLLATVPHTQTEHDRENLRGIRQAPGDRTITTSCSGYRRGTPMAIHADIARRPDCNSGTQINNNVIIDHMDAFGFDNGKNDWRSCTAAGFPELPAANRRICYRTTVYYCTNDLRYYIYAKRRNLQGLQNSCPEESVLLRTTDNSNRILQSPRYGCTRGRKSRKYFYRRNEFCLYNVSIPECESEIIIIEREESNVWQELQGRSAENRCSDYLQFYYGNVSTHRYCGTELSPLQLRTIPATQFLAVFWTDPAINKIGFKLRARCLPLEGQK